MSTVAFRPYRSSSGKGASDGSVYGYGDCVGTVRWRARLYNSCSSHRFGDQTHEGRQSRRLWLHNLGEELLKYL